MLTSVFEFITLSLSALHPSVMIPLLLVGFIFWNHKVWGIAIVLTIFSLIYNPALKALFKVPLPLNLGKNGFAFPSGHMQLAVTLYGWIALSYRDVRLRIGIGCLLGLIGISLVYRGYHYVADIFGAIGFGGILIWVAYKLNQIKTIKKTPAFLSLISLPAGIGLIAYMTVRQTLPVHSVYAMVGLAIFTAFWMYAWPPIQSALKKRKIVK